MALRHSCAEAVPPLLELQGHPAGLFMDGKGNLRSRVPHASITAEALPEAPAPGRTFSLGQAHQRRCGKEFR
ncbi:MAG: hypothetical protein VKI81_01200 [Synechococcaceae cyanobacterium]|nr:hypothetical protein [Synechococcaceae cyanobacterium]